MTIKFNPLKNQIGPGVLRVGIHKNELYLETKNPFFLVRFFRWIRRDYAHKNIVQKMNVIASNMLQSPPSFKAKDWQTFKDNYLFVTANYYKTDLIGKADALYRQIEDQNRIVQADQPQQAQPVNFPLNQAPARPPQNNLPENYNPADFGDAVLPDYNPADFEGNEEPVDQIAILNQLWNETLDEDAGWEDKPLNRVMNDESISEKLATPASILGWVVPSMKAHIVEEDQKANRVEMIARLLQIIGIATPRDCMRRGLEPTVESFTTEFRRHEKSLIQKLTAQGFLKA